MATAPSEHERPAQTLEGVVAGLFRASPGDFRTAAVEALDVGFEGIVGDEHAGWTRRSGGREPWYRRATEMRNDRQLSIVSPGELIEIAARLGVPEIRPEWIGANLLLDGIPALTRLPPRTLLFFAGGATLKIDGDNAPCRKAGRAIADQFPDRPDIELGFVKAAASLRGLVGWIEKPGRIAAGERIVARVPPQRLYPPA